VAKLKKRNKNKNGGNKVNSYRSLPLPEGLKRSIWGILLFLLALIILFSFFKASGVAGALLMKLFFFLIGKATFFLPLVLFISAIICLWPKYSNFTFPLIAASLILVLGIAGIFASLTQYSHKEVLAGEIIKKEGGWLGYFISTLLIKSFGFWIAQIIILTFIFLGGFILWQLIKKEKSEIKSIEEIEKSPKLIFLNLREKEDGWATLLVLF